MPTVTGENKAAFDKANMQQKGLLSRNPKPEFINVGKNYVASREYGGDIPNHELITPFPNKSVGMVKSNPNMVVRTTKSGEYELHHMPQWGGLGKEFIGKHTDLTRLITSGIERFERSVKGQELNKERKEKNSLFGMLNKEYGDSFSQARSTQSVSKYITHDPSGTKIRISDHSLPIHYEQPDVDLRIHQTPKEQFEIIKKYLEAKE
jgi:hypothetical protein